MGFSVYFLHCIHKFGKYLQILGFISYQGLKRNAQIDVINVIRHLS